jgi:hypothetical protein
MPSSSTAAAEPATFFAAVQAAYREAAQSTAQIERWYSVCGQTIRLCFAGSALIGALTPALDHLASAPPAQEQQADLTLCIWDSESTRTPRLVAPWTLEQIELRGEVPAYSDDRYLTMTQLDMPAMSMLDKQAGLGYFWLAAPEHIFVFERAAPMKALLHWWLRDRGLPMIHAAAIGVETERETGDKTNQSAALIVGKTGSGKSTTSFIADDRCLLEFAEPDTEVAGEVIPFAHCIYNSAKLHADHMQSFPHLLHHLDHSHAPVFGARNALRDASPYSAPDSASNSAPVADHPSNEKSLVFVHQFAPRQIAHRLPIRALLLARVAHTTDTTLSPIGRMAVLRELTTSTLVYQPGAAQAEIQAMTRLVQSVPCYQINLGRDWAQIPQVIRQAIEGTIAT